MWQRTPSAERRHSMQIMEQGRRGSMEPVPQPMTMVSGRRGSVVDGSMVSGRRGSMVGGGGRRGSMELFVDIPLTNHTVEDTAWTSEVVVCRQERDQSGVYGIGVRVDVNPPNPFMVLSVQDLWDQANRDISSTITVGDKLVYVNDRSVIKEGESIIQSTILGEKNSLVKLTLEDRSSHQLYERVVKRHIPVRTWDFTRKWYEVHEAFRGQQLSTNDSIVRALDAMRRAVIASDGRDMDFLAGIKKTGSSCGMHLKGRTVLKVVKGSPAHFAEIREGDTIAAIDGQRGEDQMAAALGSHQRIGSICTASVVRRGERLEVELARTQVSAMQRTEELIDFVELSCEHDPELRAALLEYVEGLERERQYEERVLAGRLNRMATSLLQSVTRAANTLAPAPPAAPDFDVDALMAAERRERARGDALEKQLGEAQSRIDVLECSEEHLKEQLEELRRQLAAMVPAAELAAAQEENTGLRREVEGLRREMLGMVGRGELEAAQRECEGLQAQLEALKQQMANMVPRSELEKAEEELRGSKAQAAALAAEVEGLRREMLGMVGRGELEAAQRECEGLQAQLEALKQQMANMVPRSELEKAETELRATKERAEALEQKVSGLEAELRGSQKECGELREKLATAERELKAATELAASLEAKVSGLEAELRGSQKECGELREKLATTETELKASKERAADLEKQNAELKEAAEKLEVKVAGLEAKVVSLSVPDFDTRGSTFTKKLPIAIRGREGSMIYANVRPSSAEAAPPTKEAFDTCVQSPLVLLLEESCVVSAASALEGFALSEVRSEEFTLETPPPPPPELVGVGMVVSRPKDAAAEPKDGKEAVAEVRVKEIDEGSPVQIDGTIAVGDVLVEVDGQGVAGLSMSEISDLILGPAGSEVSLLLEKAEFRGRREPAGMYTAKLARAKSERQVGVGMMLSRPRPKAEGDGDDVSRNILVKEIYSGCAVAENGVIEVGDIVLEINDQHVAEMAMSDIERLIKGKEGSEITFVVQKPTEEKVAVTLVRKKEPDGIVTRVFDQSISLLDNGRNLVMGQLQSVQSLLTPRKGSTIMYPDGTSETVYWAV